LKISVITVTYNSAATVVDTLRSVACQTHADIEHIVIDGGSRDATLALVAEHGRHVARVVSEPDKGIYDAMNKGLRLATGEFVGFLNSDDVFGSDASLERIALAGADPQADAVFGDLVYFNPGRPAKPQVRYWRAGTFAHAKLRLGWMPPHPTLYVRRQVIEQVGAFDANLRIAADYDFMLRLFSRPALKAVHVPQVLVHMRTGGASNRSISAMVRKSREDLAALRRPRAGGFYTLVLKNLRKLPQFFARTPARRFDAGGSLRRPCA
jgi:glycosyltransferase